MARNDDVLTFRERLTVLNEDAYVLLRLALKTEPPPVVNALKALALASDACVDNAER